MAGAAGLPDTAPPSSSEHDVHSPFLGIDVSGAPNLTAVLLADFARWPDRPAVIDAAAAATGDVGDCGACLTFGQVEQQIRRAASRLRMRFGLRREDVVGIWSPNDVRYLSLAHGVNLAGGAVVPIGASATDGECERQLRDATACLLLAHVSLLSPAAMVARRINIRMVVFGEGAATAPFLPGLTSLSYASLTDDDDYEEKGSESEEDSEDIRQSGGNGAAENNGGKEAAAAEAAAAEGEAAMAASEGKERDGEDDPASWGRKVSSSTPHVRWLDTFMMPSGGATTGLPKAVIMRHSDLVFKLAQLEPAEGRFLREGDVAFLLGPLSHSYGGLMGLAFLPHKGVTTLLWPAPLQPRVDCEGVLAAIQRHRASTLYLAPSSLRQLVGYHGLSNFDLSSVRRIVTHGSALTPELQLQAAELFGCVVKQIYGVTEASAVVAVAPDDAVKPGTGAIGPLLPNIVARIIDPAKGTGSGGRKNGTAGGGKSGGVAAALPAGTEGLLLIGGPGLSGGYWVNERATAAAVSRDGFVRTGDVARFDDDGYLYIVGRTKEGIRCMGMTVAPAELESLLLLHPEVDDVCVLGRPDPDDAASGELATACVVPMEPGSESAQLAAELVAFVEQRAAAHKRLLGGVIFVESIPYKRGHLNRKALRDALVAEGKL